MRRKENSTMAQSTRDESEIARDFRELDRTEQAMLQRVGGSLTAGQRMTLENLERLVKSLAGPEDVLDNDNYSRPFPPRHPRESER
jgi:hypothetical protein